MTNLSLQEFQKIYSSKMSSCFIFLLSFIFISSKLTRSQIFETSQIHHTYDRSESLISDAETSDGIELNSGTRVVVSLRSTTYPGRPKGIKSLYLCQNCSIPEKDPKAIHLDGLVASKGPQSFDLKSVPLVYAVPNHGEGGDTRTINSEEMYNAIVVFDRGAGVTIVEKVLIAQDFSAIGVIIIDDGACDEDMRQCGARTGDTTNGFSTMDHWASWSQVKIPCILITQKRGEKLRQLMEVFRADIHGMGKQFIDSSYSIGVRDELNKDEL